MSVTGGFLLDTSGDLWLLWGSGSPIGAATADRGKGSLYVQLDAIPGDFLWVKAAPANPTAWNPVLGPLGQVPMLESADAGGGEDISGGMLVPGPIGPQGPAGVPAVTMLVESDVPEEPYHTPGPQGPQGPSGFNATPTLVEPESPDEPMQIPGPAGAAGSAGAAGAPGVSVVGIDGTDGEDAVMIPGIPGAAGTAGTPGAAGVSIVGMDGLDGEDGQAIPGTPGPAGSPGAAGAQGSSILGLDGADGEDGYPIPGPAGPAGSGTSLPVTLLVQTADATISANYSGYAVDGYEVAAGVALECAAGAVMEVG